MTVIGCVRAFLNPATKLRAPCCGVCGCNPLS